MTVTNALGEAGRGDADFTTVNGGFGLTGMRERLLLIGGTLTARGHDGQWTVTAKAPQ